jgi:AcrR family transcriptional regulator
MILATAPSPRQQAILDAALDAFLEKGVLATTIDDVRAGSGASVGSIYHHYGSKEGIAAALFVEGMRGYQDGAGAALRAGGVKGFVRRHVRWVADNPRLAAYLFTQREPSVEQASRDELAAINRAFFADVRDWIAAQDDLRPLPFDLFEAVVLGPAQEWSRQWLAGNAETSPQRAARVLADAAWAAVRKETPA